MALSIREPAQMIIPPEDWGLSRDLGADSVEGAPSGFLTDVQEVGDEDGGGAEVEERAHAFVFLEQDGGENDAVDGLEVDGEIDGVDGEAFEEVSIPEISAKGAGNGESEEGKPVGGGGKGELEVGDDEDR